MHMCCGALHCGGKRLGKKSEFRHNFVRVSPSLLSRRIIHLGQQTIDRMLASDGLSRRMSRWGKPPAAGRMMRCYCDIARRFIKNNIVICNTLGEDCTPRLEPRDGSVG